ncbi:MAG: sugar ABC transporter ATP-binding protein [Burkholderiaceae bacterium]|nr:sugar ABC transporter ATP-binding protein [Burkholderiaceae bacterium]
MNAVVDASACIDRAPVVRVRRLSKRYGQHLALDSVTLDLQPGEVHVLFGENGAGKSTLISMLAGALEPSAGEIETDGCSGTFASVAQARAHGVRAVFQEFSLVPMLTVGENIMLGEEPCRGLGMLAKAAAREEARRLIDASGFSLEVDELVANLPRGKQQMVEICKALRRTPRVLILDEPTASLSEHDARALFALVRRLKDDGIAIVYITHRMHEIPALGDRVTVLRDGRQIATVPADTPEARLIELMTGRTLAKIYPSLNPRLGEVRLSIRNLSLVPEPGTVTVRDASLTVRAGEVVGIAGLVGCGKSELAQACFGLKPLAAGTIVLDGRPTRFKHPADAIAQGLWYSPADRKHDGLALGLAAGQNMSLSALRFGALRAQWLRPRREKSHLTELSGRVDFAAQRLREPAANFSGGNQQKVLLAKGLAQDIGVYVFDEPTVGIDVGARLAIYRCLADLSKAGAAILLVSSDLPELLGMTHRLLVMNDGRIACEFSHAEYDEHRILEQFF